MKRRIKFRILLFLCAALFITWVGHAVFRSHREYSNLIAAVERGDYEYKDYPRERVLQMIGQSNGYLIGMPQFLKSPFRENFVFNFGSGWAVPNWQGKWLIKIF
jgi:hypothetical protein